jgi:hypothetical protein
MLQNAVHPVQELRAVKTQADQHKTQSGTDLTYDQYVSLLLSAASTYDAQFTTKTPFAARTPRHAVYSHDVAGSNDGDDSDYDIDSRIDIIQAYGHSTRPPGTSMALTQWTQLSQDAKDIWDKLSDESKAIILDRKPRENSTRPPGRGPPRPPFRNASLHDVSVYDYILANTHDIRTGSEGDVDDPTETRSVSFTGTQDTTATSEDKPSTTILVNAARQQHPNVSPADLCKVLSSTMTRYSGTGTPPKPDDTELLVVNGKKYRSVNAAIRYSISVLLVGLIAGLFLGLMTLDALDLQIIGRASVDEDERKYAAKLLPIVSQRHRLLVTLLILNALAYETLPIFLDALVPSWAA